MGQQALYQGPDRSEYFWLCGHIVSATTIQLYHCSKKTATDNMQMSKCDCVLIKLYLQKRYVSIKLHLQKQQDGFVQEM